MCSALYRIKFQGNKTFWFWTAGQNAHLRSEDMHHALTEKTPFLSLQEIM